MDFNAYQGLTEDQKLKVMILNSTKKIVNEVAKDEEVEFDSNSTELMAEVVWKKLQLMGADLEQFANHAKRTTINVDDVKLLVRRNPDLKKHIAKKAEELSSASVSTKEKAAPAKRKRKL